MALAPFARFTAGRALLEVGGRVEPPAVAPVIRGRPHLLANDSPRLPATLAPPREGFPLLACPAASSPPCDLKEWAAAARSLLDDRLAEASAILLRGLPLESPADFSEFYRALGYEPMDYVGLATRDEVAPGVYTTNVSQPEKTIMLHNEMAAERLLPAHLFLFCESPPPEGAGGETPIGRNADWSAELGPEILERFARRGFARRLHSPSRQNAASSATTWQRRYQTEDPRVVESQCAEQGDAVEWGADGSLTTWRFLDALLEHHGQRLWFATLPNSRPVTSTEACYGDREPVEPEVVDLTRASQWRISVAFSWRKGDVLCLDNLGCQHGRLSFAKNVDRRIFVSIATPTPGIVRDSA